MVSVFPWALEALLIELEELLSLVEFEGMSNRFEQIEQAHYNTFEWIFTEEDLEFAPWLRSEETTFWITGKPASGKSTLMKMLYNSVRTTELFKSSVSSAVLAGFFFHDQIGVPLLKTHEGLLRAIIFQTVKHYPELIPTVFPGRWERLVSRNSAAEQKLSNQPLSLRELKDGFSRLARQTQTTMQLLLIIDGLDEFEGDHEETLNLLTDFVDEARKHHRVKLCLSSRPEAVFSIAFTGYRQLQVHQLSEGDIQRYAHCKFEDLRRCVSKLYVTDEQLDDLVTRVQSRSLGVFLWVRLVVHDLIKGAKQYENFWELITRLDAMPSELSHLFDQIVYRIDPLHRQQAAKMFSIVDWRRRHSLLSLQLALADDAPNMEMEIGSPDQDDISRRRKHMQDIIESRMGHLLEIGTDLSGISDVDFLHLTFREHLQSPSMKIWLAKNISEKSFSPYIACLRSCLLELRYLRFEEGEFDRFKGETSTTGSRYSNLIDEAMKCATAAETSDDSSYIHYLNILDSLCNRQYLNYRRQEGDTFLRQSEVAWERKYGKLKSWISYILAGGRGCWGYMVSPSSWETDFESWATTYGLRKFVEWRIRHGYKPQSRLGRPLLSYASDEGRLELNQPCHPTGLIIVNLPIIKYLLEEGADPNSSHHEILPGHVDERIRNWPISNKTWTPWKVYVESMLHDMYPVYSSSQKQERWAHAHVEAIKAFIAHGADLGLIIAPQYGRPSGPVLHVIQEALSRYHQDGVWEICEAAKSVTNLPKKSGALSKDQTSALNHDSFKNRRINKFRLKLTAFARSR